MHYIIPFCVAHVMYPDVRVVTRDKNIHRIHPKKFMKKNLKKIPSDFMSLVEWIFLLNHFPKKNKPMVLHTSTQWSTTRSFHKAPQVPEGDLLIRRSRLPTAIHSDILLFFDVKTSD